ncbi:MAG: response regulator [Gammaproteobacteria bacterium]|nr:response regulator [Gammaproteobacteria bacterium]
MFKDSVALVLDSSTHMINVITIILKERLEFGTVIGLTDGKEAKKVLEGRDIDWIICDFEMPGISGIELLEYVRNDPKMVDTPFIMTSARSDRASLHEAVSAGVTDYLSKPFNSDALHDKFHRFMRNKDRRIDNRVTPDEPYECVMRREDDGTSKGALVNISVSGCMIVVPVVKGINVFDEVSVALSLSETPINIMAAVVRLEAADEDKYPKGKFIQIGLHFAEYKDNVKHELNKFINKHRIDVFKV